MEVLEDIIAKVIGLDMEGVNFYREKKMSNKVLDELHGALCFSKIETVPKNTQRPCFF